MNEIDFSNYLFRASALGHLMTKPRNKTEILSESAKTYLRDIFIKEVYSREKLDIKNKFTNKGIMCESDSLDLVKEVTGETFFKNQKHFENGWVKGTPDVVDEDIVKDIKTSWDIWTYAKVDESVAKSSYYFQVFTYMWLTGKKKAQLIYCLVNTPDEIIEHEAYKASWQFPELSESDEAKEAFRHNYIFDDIPAKERMKVFEFDFEEELVEAVKEKISAGRTYLMGLTL